MKLPQRIQLIPASRSWLNDAASKYHYMHRPIHAKSSPFGWRVICDGSADQPDGSPSGFIIFSSIHYTKLAGIFGYEGLPTKWQVLSLSRLWLHDDLPHLSATVVIAKAIKLVQRRWLEVHPPRFPDQPYHILRIISYADTRFHTGTVYRAANFEEHGRTVSASRHKGTRGAGMDGAELIRFIYRLPKPNWEYSPVAGLPLFN